MILTLSFALLALGSSSQNILSEGELRQLQMVSRSHHGGAIESVRALKPAAVHSALQAAFSDRTRVMYRENLGILVEYSDPSGGLRLWQPGRSDAVIGRWAAQLKKKTATICFIYDGASPSTGIDEHSRCLSAEQALGSVGVLREWRGDVFRLMSGSAPYEKSAMGMPEP